MKEAGCFLWDLRTPMRDGVELSTDLYLPPGGLAGGPYPVVLIRTSEDNQRLRYVERARVLAADGIAVAIQDVRGRQDSAGVFAPFENEGRDGYDAVEWFAAQEWCDGKVGLLGWAYSAWAAWAAAAEHPPHLVTIASTSAWDPAPVDGPVELKMFAWLHAMCARVWQDGSQVDWERVFAHHPARTMDTALGRDVPAWREWLDGAWKPLSLLDFSTLGLPALHVTGWRDTAQRSALRIFEGMRASSPEQVLVVGPWDCADGWRLPRFSGGADFGATAAEDSHELHRRWFARWLQGADDAVESRVFFTGDDEWRSQTWMSAVGVSTLYLRSDGRLASESPGLETPDSFTYDPGYPLVLTPGLTFYPTAPNQRIESPIDRRFLERRPDVVVYSSDPLADQLEIIGRPRVDLFVGADSDVFVQLTDVAPGGASLLLAEGRSAKGEMSAVAHVLKAGHRLRLTVTGSWFPVCEQPPLAASYQVFHDAERPSRLALPVVTA